MLSATGSPLVVESAAGRTAMAQQRIKALRAFRALVGGVLRTVEVDEIIDVPGSFAREVVSSNKAQMVDARTSVDVPPPDPAAVQRPRAPRRKEAEVNGAESRQLSGETDARK